MQTIWKYKLDIVELQFVNMPLNSKILTVMMQDTQLCLWAEVLPDIPTEDRTIEIFGTGNPMDYTVNRKYIGSVNDGVFIWHIYEQL